MPSDFSILARQWLHRLFLLKGAGWGVDPTRPLGELALRGGLSAAHLGLEQALRGLRVRREVRHRGEMRWALWRIPLSGPRGLRRRKQTLGRGRLLWIPGWGDTPLSWMGVATMAAAGHGFDELILLDFPGFHGSLAHSPCITRMDRFFEITGDLGRELKPGVIVGHSLGGWLAAKLALDLETSFEKLLLISPSGVCGGEQEREKWRAEFESFVASPDAAAYGSRLFARPPPGWKRLGGVFVPFLSRQDTREFLDSIERRHFLDEGFLDQLGRLSRAPLELLWGERDQVVPARFAGQWTRVLPQARLTLWSDIGHMPHLEAPVRLVRWLRGRLGSA